MNELTSGRDLPVARQVRRPDPRPMRVVYGAGAAAAMSVMVVGLVQPDWSTAEVERAPRATADPPSDGAVADEQAPRRRVRHVTRYVYLKAGHAAPPGATVIKAPAGSPQPAANRPGRNFSTATPKPPRHRAGSGGNNAAGNNAAGNNAGPVATARPTPRPSAPHPAGDTQAHTEADTQAGQDAPVGPLGRSWIVCEIQFAPNERQRLG